MRRMPRLALEGATRGKWVDLRARRMMTLGLGLMSETEPYCRWTAPARQIVLAIEIWSTVARLIEFPSPSLQVPVQGAQGSVWIPGVRDSVTSRADDPDIGARHRSALGF
jgi:hypothetical protein